METPIPIRHLLTHTAGLTYGLFPVIPAEMVYLKEFNLTPQPPLETLLRWTKFPELAQWVPHFAKIPLVSQPGKRWLYSHAHDVIGYLIEKLSGKKLDEFLKDRIFDKLGMTDTDFFVPTDKLDRFTKVYTFDDSKQLIQLAGQIEEVFKMKPRFLSGRGGLVSTINDYLKFTVMMLQGGMYNEIQVVSKEIIDLMTQNHLPDNKSTLDMFYVPIKDPSLIKLSEGYGFGLGIRVKIADNITSAGIGSHEWGGAMNTIYWIDPKNQLVCILMTQFCLQDLSSQFNIDQPRIKKLVYQSINR